MHEFSRDEKTSESGKLDEAKTLALKAFTIKSAEPESEDTGFERLMDELRQFAKDAIRTENTGSLEGVSRTFEEIHRAWIEACKRIGAKFTPEMVRNEVSIFGDEWAPLEELRKSFRQLFSIAFSQKDLSWDTKRAVEFMPFHLCIQAYDEAELLSFSKLIVFSELQAYEELSKTGEITDGSLEWARSLLRHRILSDMEEREREPTRFGDKNITDYAKAAFRAIQGHAKPPLISIKPSIFEKQERPSLNRFVKSMKI